MPINQPLLARRVVSSLPFGEDSAVNREVPWQDAVSWPCRWIGLQENPPGPWVAAFRCSFELAEPLSSKIHVSADQQHEFYINGVRQTRGVEIGDEHNWYVDTFDLELPAGRHVFVAQVINYGSFSPWCLLSVLPGFFLCPENPTAIPLFGTGVAPWTAKLLPGYRWTDATAMFVVGTGPCFHIDARTFAWGFTTGEGDGWKPVAINEAGNNGYTSCPSEPVHLLKPSTLPDRLEIPVCGIHVRAVLDREVESFPSDEPDESEKKAWEEVLTGRTALSIPAGATRVVLLELGNYYCAYPQLIASGGLDTEVSIIWAETLWPKPNLASGLGSLLEVKGKRFSGYGDTFILDGGSRRVLEPMNWKCGCFVLIKIVTKARPMSLDALTFLETRYPFQVTPNFQSDDDELAKISTIALRTLQMCMHDTYMDCPYYERLMYVGDTRIQTLLTYALSLDDRLPRKALELFDASRINFQQLTLGAYPGKTKFIPPFSLWWVGMVYDYALWRGDEKFIRPLVTGARTVVEFFLGCRDKTGLVQSSRGWNFIDWAFPGGVPEGGFVGTSALINLQLALALNQLSAIEDFLEEPELSQRAARLAGDLMAKIMAAFWDEKRGLFADDLERRHFSEHGQCLALISDLLPAPLAQRVATSLSQPGLCPATIYFAHYVFEAAYKSSRADILFRRLNEWRLCAKAECYTFPETIDPRSQCHAWSASPLYHFTTSILGLRPEHHRLGFNGLRVRPCLGPLQKAQGELPHHRGPIRASYHRKGDAIHAHLSLPEGLSGLLEWGDNLLPLHPGKNECVLEPHS